MKCELCNSTIINCQSCLNLTNCIQCTFPFYLKSDFTMCLDDCSTDIYTYGN